MTSEPYLPDQLADDWAEIQEVWADALRRYQQLNPELIELMVRDKYFKTMLANVFANGWVWEKMAGENSLS